MADLTIRKIDDNTFELIKSEQILLSELESQREQALLGRTEQEGYYDAEIQKLQEKKKTYLAEFDTWLADLNKKIAMLSKATDKAEDVTALSAVVEPIIP